MPRTSTKEDPLCLPGRPPKDLQHPPHEICPQTSRIEVNTTQTTKHDSHKQEEGAIRQRWLTDPTAPNCPIQPATLTLHDLVRDNWDYTKRRMEQPEEILPDPIATTLPQGRKQYRMQRVKKTSSLDRTDKVNKHFNLICEGAIFGKNIYRFDGPHWSQITQAMYQRYFPIQSLKHVFFTNIDNSDTISAVRDQVYRGNGLPWPPVGDPGFRVWDFDGPECQCILGTRLGKAVVYLLLGAFPRGTWRIARVATWCWDSELQMRFDVEKCEAFDY